MINYTLKINGTSYGFEVGASLTKDGSDKFDVGTIIIKNITRESKFDEGSKVRITATTDTTTKTFEYIIQADKVDKVSIDKYNHSISLVEPTAILQKKIAVDRFFTLKDDGTLFNHSEILDIIRKTNKYNDDYLFAVDEDTNILLASVLSPPKRYEGMTVYQQIEDVFRGINAVPRLTLSGLLTHDEYNKTNNPITINSVINQSKEFDIYNYASNVVSNIKNATYNGDLESGCVWFPNKTNAITPRTEAIKYDDNSAYYDLDRPIERIVKVIIPELQLTVGGPIEADITEYVVKKEKWDGLELGDDNPSILYTQHAQRNSLYWEDRYIKNLGATYKTYLVFDTDVLENVIKSYLYNNTSGVGLYVATPIKDIAIRVFFQPKINAQISSKRADKDYIFETEILNNQKDREIDLGRYGKILNDLVNRLSNGNYILQLSHKSVEDIKELFDYTQDNYKIIKATYTLMPEEIIGTYELAKNYVTIDGYQVGNRGNYPFQIIGDKVETNFRITDYVELSTTLRATTGRLTLQGLKTLLNIFDYASADDLPIYHMQYSSLDDNVPTGYCINLSCVGIAGDGMRFMSQFNNVKYVSNQKFIDGSVSLMKPIRYTDENGFMDKAKLQLVNNFFSNEDNYPEGEFGTAIVDIEEIQYNLNANELFGMNYELLYDSDEEGIIVTDLMSSENNLIKPYSSKTFLIYVSNSNTVYTYQDKKIKDKYLQSALFTFNKDNRYIDVTTVGGTNSRTWALGDDQENLYFAVNFNGTARRRIYFNNLRKSTYIQNILLLVERQSIEATMTCSMSITDVKNEYEIFTESMSGTMTCSMAITDEINQFENITQTITATMTCSMTITDEKYQIVTITDNMSGTMTCSMSLTDVKYQNPPTAQPDITDYTAIGLTIYWQVLNNDSLTATIKTEVGDSTPDLYTIAGVASGAKTPLQSQGVATTGVYTIYATAQASGYGLSVLESQAILIK